LILQANPELSWRDVKHILASTATIIDPSSQVYSHPLERDLVGHTYQEGWVQNDAGYFFHNYYGFGLINAKAAIDMALSYAVDLGELTETTYEEGNWIYQSALLNQVIPDESA